MWRGRAPHPRDWRLGPSPRWAIRGCWRSWASGGCGRRRACSRGPAARCGGSWSGCWARATSSPRPSRWPAGASRTRRCTTCWRVCDGRRAPRASPPSGCLARASCCAPHWPATRASVRSPPRPSACRGCAGGWRPTWSATWPTPRGGERAEAGDRESGAGADPLRAALRVSGRAGGVAGAGPRRGRAGARAASTAWTSRRGERRWCTTTRAPSLPRPTGGWRAQLPGRPLHARGGGAAGRARGRGLLPAALRPRPARPGGARPGGGGGARLRARRRA